MRKQIIVIEQLNSWVAWFKDDGETKKLMGTDVLPTPFTLKTPRHDVIKALSELNPTYQVISKESHDLFTDI